MGGIGEAARGKIIYFLWPIDYDLGVCEKALILFAGLWRVFSLAQTADLRL